MNAQAQQIVEAEPIGSQTPLNEAGALISMIERAARDPAVDVEKFERLMALSERAQDRRKAELADIEERRKEEVAEAARRAFNTAMVAAQAEIKPVVANADNTQTHSRYATLDAIGDAIDEIITKNGFAMIWGVSERSPKEGCERVVCDVVHLGGHERHEFADVPNDAAGFKGTANKTATHALGSTISYGRRYLTIMVFNVKSRRLAKAMGIGDDDGNAAGGRAAPELIDSEQYGKLLAQMKAVSADTPRFLAYFNIEALADLPARRFGEAMSTLQMKSNRK